MTKAYDQVEWSILGNILALMGCDEKFVHMVNECVSIATFCVLLNGSPFLQV